MSEVKNGSPPIDVFCHIPKTGGMTFNHMLRRYFGSSHLAGTPRSGWVYDAADLDRDLRIFPNIRSLGGHSMRPFVDFGPLEHRMRWYTILRDPVARTISNYQHQVEKQGRETPFLQWLEKPYNQNWHVRMLAGEQDLDAAKNVLSRFACIGFIDRYNDFLLLLRDRLGWRDFNPTYRRIKNPARSGDVRQEIKKDIDTYRQAIEEANNLDLQLYEFANLELYPRQVEEYGEERLTSDLKRVFASPRESGAERRRVWAFNLVNRGIYPALVKLDRRPPTVILSD